MELLKELKRHEGFEPRVYKCTEGVDTIGYGFAIKDLYLDEDLIVKKELIDSVKQLFGRNLYENEFFSIRNKINKQINKHR